MSTSFIKQLSNCQCCPRECGVNRLAGETGYCGIDARVQISYAGLHLGEEPPISGSRGSGTIFFVGCNLRCVFCQNYQISQEYERHDVRYLTNEDLADEMLKLQSCGAHNINFVSPSHVVFQMADGIETAKRRGLTIPIVYNSNGYDSIDSLQQLRGLIDIYMPDIKYMDDELGVRYSDVHNYTAIIPDILDEMYQQVGNLIVDDQSIAMKGLLVRHLVLPNHLENSRRCLEVLSQISPDIFVSIMAQYSPRYKACDHPLINRPLRASEYAEVVDYALDLGLDNAFVQELYSQKNYLPRFDRENPFD